MKYLRQVLLLIYVSQLFVVLAYAQKYESFQYLSPKPNSKLVSRQSNIIIRQGDKIDRGSILNSSLITVRGSQNGFYSGEIILSDDEKTLLFNPGAAFEPGEKVTVSLNTGLKTLAGKDVNPISFSFTITPLDKPIQIDPVSRKILDDFSNNIEMTTSMVSSINGDSLPADFPEIVIGEVNNPAPGNIFISNMPGPRGTSGTFVIIVDNDGNIVDYKRVPTIAWDFKVLPNGLLSHTEVIRNVRKGYNEVVWRILDSTLAVVDSFQCKNGYTAEQHDFQLLPNGHMLLIAYDPQPVDMSQIVAGGRPDAIVTGAIVQELDYERNVVFQWRSWDYIPITDAYANLKNVSIDYVHLNSVEFDTDGNILISGRALSEVTKISRTTGEIIWRLGGKQNEFTFINENEANAPLYFSKQHDARRIANGNITIFDNGSQHNPPYSRAVEYQLDEENKTATLVWEYRNTPDIYTQSLGSMQRLPNGNTIIGWGNRSEPGFPALSEITPDKTTAFELSISTSENTYRAYKFPFPDGAPCAEVTHYEVAVGNTYVFAEGDSNDTGITIKINNFSGSGYNSITVTKYCFAPLQPQFIDKAPLVQPVRVVISADAITSIDADIQFDVDNFHVSQPETTIVFHREFEGKGLFFPFTTSYNHVTKKIATRTVKFGEFILARPDLESLIFTPMPYAPVDSSTVNQTLPVTLCWNPIGYVNTYNLQVAKDENFSNFIVNEEHITDALFTIDAVEENTEYFWRVKAFNDAGESDWSTTQMFTTIAPFVSLLVPNGGEQWQLGLRYFIQWDDNLGEEVVIELYKAESLSGIIDTTSSSGAYQWEIDTGLQPGLDYKIKVKSVVENTLFDVSDNTFSIIDTTGASVTDRGEVIDDYALYQNYPNPFNPVTHIRFSLAKEKFVTLKIYDVRGYEVMTLISGHKQTGSHTVLFDASQLSSGLYLYKLETPSFSQARKMIVMK